jgi:small GTP-binding protein
VNNLEKRKYFFKVLVAGPPGAGKTSLLRRYIKGKFDESTLMTIGVDFYYKVLEFNENLTCSLQLWDFGGQKQFEKLHETYVKGASGALLLIDLTRIPDMDIVIKWMNIVRLEKENLPVVILGSKTDLKELIIVDEGFMKKIMDIFNINHYLKTSAKTGVNVDKAFRFIVEEILKKKNII